MSDAIFNSKLYRCSTRKSKIQSAMKNAINQPLVKQLKVYLDDEYIKEEYLEPDKLEDEVKNVEDVAEDTSAEAKGTDNTESDTAKPDIKPAKSKKSESEDVPDKVDVPESEPIEESITVTSGTEANTTITSSTTTTLSTDVLLGQLNIREDTQGVSRVTVTGDEVWIYYDGKVNPNNKVDVVIAALASAGYAQLEFNRFVRTDNAMVFVTSDTSAIVR